MTELPKKILRIQELTFILPDDFSGTVEDATELLLQYRAGHLKDAQFNDPNNTMSTLELLVTSNRDEKVCGDGAVYELINGHYHLIDATNPYFNDMSDEERKRLSKIKKEVDERLEQDNLI